MGSVTVRRHATPPSAANAVVFEAPGQLSVQSLNLVEPSNTDLVVDVTATGISTGTERLLWDGEMPDFPGMGYPLVPGYEAVGTVASVGSACNREVGEFVFVGGSHSFPAVHNLFGSAASTLIVPADKALPIERELGDQGLLLALAATAHHALHIDLAKPAVPDLLIGHGILGRLVMRLCAALGYQLPTVWEINSARMQLPERSVSANSAGSSLDNYRVIHPEADDRKDYQHIMDVSGDSNILHQTLPRLQKRTAASPPPEVLLAGFYRQPLSFNFVDAFMREVRIQVAAEWTPADMQSVTDLISKNNLSLAGLISHTLPATQASAAYEQAFRDDECLKMALDWREVQ